MNYDEQQTPILPRIVTRSAQPADHDLVSNCYEIHKGRGKKKLLSANQVILELPIISLWHYRTKTSNKETYMVTPVTILGDY